MRIFRCPIVYIISSYNYSSPEAKILGMGESSERYIMNTQYNFNSIMGIEEESTPTEAANTKDQSTFDKVVVTAAKVGVIAGATILTVAAVNTLVGEAAVGVTAAKSGIASVKNHFTDKKANKATEKAKEIAAFRNSLIDQGYSKEQANEMTNAEYHLNKG